MSTSAFNKNLALRTLKEVIMKAHMGLYAKNRLFQML